MRTKKAMVNSITSLLYQFILIASGLIVPRMVLANYGSDCNGVVSSVTQFMSIVSLLTIGLTAATRVELYKSLASNDYLRTSQVVYTTKMYMHISDLCLGTVFDISIFCALQFRTCIYYYANTFCGNW